MSDLVKCCGREMEVVGYHLVEGKMVESLRCNCCEQGVGVKETRFENGKMRADGMAERIDQKDMPIERSFMSSAVDIRQMTAEKAPGYQFAGKAESDERKRMNQMVTYMVACKKVGMGTIAMKTREQRRAELAVLLEREVEL